MKRTLNSNFGDEENWFLNFFLNKTQREIQKKATCRAKLEKL